MGMDVHGKRFEAERDALWEKFHAAGGFRLEKGEYDKAIGPINELDKQPRAYFRNNWWWWRPLWAYCCELAPDIITDPSIGHSNDGRGLDAGGARALSDRLMTALNSGHTKQHETEYMGELESTPDERCDLCAGTGKRADMPEQDKCNGCGGKGTRRPTSTWYPFSEENVREFAEFLAECGGFSCD